MKTISITIDDALLTAVDRAARSARRTRSAVCRVALESWLRGLRRGALARAECEAYQRTPAQPDEFGGLIEAQPFLRRSRRPSR